MRPTVDDQLAGIDRLLELVQGDPTLGSESALLLRDARRQLGRLRGSVDARLPFLQWDNQATLRLLQQIKPVLSDDHQAAIDAETDNPEGSQADRNNQLRELLTLVLQELPQTDEGETARRAIVEHLLIRVNANPALNKNPIIPEQ